MIIRYIDTSNISVISGISGISSTSSILSIFSKSNVSIISSISIQVYSQLKQASLTISKVDSFSRS